MHKRTINGRRRNTQSDWLGPLGLGAALTPVPSVSGMAVARKDASFGSTRVALFSCQKYVQICVVSCRGLLKRKVNCLEYATRPTPGSPPPYHTCFGNSQRASAFHAEGPRFISWLRLQVGLEDVQCHGIQALSQGIQALTRHKTTQQVSGPVSNITSSKVLLGGRDLSKMQEEV